MRANLVLTWYQDGAISINTVTKTKTKNAEAITQGTGGDRNRFSNLIRTAFHFQMATLAETQMLAAAHKRTWRRATLEQRKQIVERYEQTGSVKEAFKNVRFNRVELSDLTFDTVGGMHVGGRR